MYIVKFAHIAYCLILVAFGSQALDQFLPNAIVNIIAFNIRFSIPLNGSNQLLREAPWNHPNSSICELIAETIKSNFTWKRSYMGCQDALSSGSDENVTIFFFHTDLNLTTNDSCLQYTGIILNDFIQETLERQGLRPSNFIQVTGVFMQRNIRVEHVVLDYRSIPEKCDSKEDYTLRYRGRKAYEMCARKIQGPNGGNVIPIAYWPGCHEKVKLFGFLWSAESTPVVSLRNMENKRLECPNLVYKQFQSLVFFKEQKVPIQCDQQNSAINNPKLSGTSTTKTINSHSASTQNPKFTNVNSTTTTTGSSEATVTSRGFSIRQAGCILWFLQLTLVTCFWRNSL